MQANAVLTGIDELATNDLGPLAWVLDELRKSLDGAIKALRRFGRDAESARGSALAALDVSQLRLARQQLHQALGALEMVGMPVPAKVLRAMETLAQKFIERPEFFSDEAVARVERASFALTEYLECVLKGKTASPVALFPQYRDVLELVGEDRVHPADLWPFEWRWIDVILPHASLPLVFDASVRAQVDQSVLKLVKSCDAAAATTMRDLSLGFAAAQNWLEERVFWTISAAYFEAVSLGLCPADVYGKRAASRILLQDRALARGETGISERLMQDLLFFCAQAEPQAQAESSVLAAVRSAYGLTQTKPVDYETPQFGRFDPAQLTQTRRRITAATETWSALAGGDLGRLKSVVEQFASLTESALRLHPESAELAHALTQAVEATARSGERPAPALAMEVATAVLHLEAVYEDLDPADSRMAERSASLARRLDHVNAGAQPEALEKWMEELYRRVSDRQIMGSVVDELRKTLAAVERSLDLFFRDPGHKVPLHEVPSQLAQMRGVFSVLGLDQAALATLRMRASVEQFLVDEIELESARSGIFLKLGNSLGAIGFLIDMLSYQRELAKKLFVYDEQLGEFMPLMGSGKKAVPFAGAGPAAPVPLDLAEPATQGKVGALDEDESEVKGIFLEEAREVIQAGLAAIESLQADPSDLAQQTALRRAFHTLKGSPRMVGLSEFGEAAWSLEQLVNAWLAEQKPLDDDWLNLLHKALHGLGRWLEDIAADAAAAWSARPFCDAADGLRLDHRVVELVLVGEEAQDDFSATQLFDPDAARAPQDRTHSMAVADQAQALSDIDLTPGAATEKQPAPADSDVDDQTKMIGTLRIGIPLYNVYLNEADEWSRRLLTELSEWALEWHQPVPASTVGWAHSLAGSSATVGFMALSNIARALEQALRHVQLHAQGSAEQAKVFVAAAEDIRRLLHQFAAGFLKEPAPTLVEALKAIESTEFSAVAGGAADSPQGEEWLDSLPDVRLETARVTQDEDQDDQDVEVLDAIDVDLFPVLEEEALELLPQLGGALRQWTVRPENLGARAEVLRVLHTLKGSARLAGAMRLGEMTHRLESAVERLGIESLHAPALEALLSRFDAIQANFERLRATPEQARRLPEAAPIATDVMAPVELAVLAANAAPTFTPLAPVRPLPNQTVRVGSQLLDRMVNQVGEVMITRSRLEARLGQLRASLGELTGNLDRLRNQLRDLELQSESQMQSRLAQTKVSAQGFDPLEFDRFTRVQELTRMMAESVHDVATVQRNLQRTVEGAEDDLIAQARQSRELQRDLLRTRMVEFEGIAERLHSVVRQAAKDADRLVKLEIIGGSIDIDRGVLNRIAPAFEHLLRNALAHGIEDPATRVAAGKPAMGLIRVELQQRGNDVTVEFSDDGAGLDLARIREKAQATGQISTQASLSDSELANLIFTPGFSTAPLVTELSGRGIGLDVVRSEVSALGGHIETATERARGTRFTLVLPLTTAVTQVVMLRMADLAIGVPANLVETVRRVSAVELGRAYQDHVFEFNGEKVPFFWGGALLQASAESREVVGKTLALAVFRSAGQRLAMHVDEVLGNQEVVVKNLGPQLSRLPGLVGMSVLASGVVVLIYNPVALSAFYSEQARQFERNAGQAAAASALTLAAAASQAPLILVVDDSITVRRVTQRLLKREGFRVALASDGLQALELLHQEKPAVVISDIEMPRMDGFDLITNIRSDATLRELPIIMISSRFADKHRERARELGVNHYLGKPYPEDELIGLVRQYCVVATTTDV